MRAFVKALSILLVGQLVAALEEPAGFGYFYTKFDKEKNLRLEDAERGDFDLEKYYQLSVDGPSRLYFSKLAKSSEWELEANIERLKPDGKGFRKCSFPIRNDERATLYYKLRGLRNQMEILEVFRAYPELKENQLDLYAINMEDCKVRKTEALKGYNYPAKQIYAINRYWDVDRIEYFTFGDEKSSDSYMNKCTYYISNNSFIGPMKFTMLDDKKDYRINMLLPVEGEDSYIASISNSKNMYQDIKVSSSGAIIQADQTESLRKATYLRYSVTNGYAGLCFREEIEKKWKLRCIQYDKNLKKNLDRIFELDYEPAMFTIRNRPEGGLYFLGLKCAKSDANSCEQPEMKWDIIGLGDELIKNAKTFKEDYCTLSTHQRFGLIDDGSLNNCLYYSCFYKSKPTDKFENGVRVKCF